MRFSVNGSEIFASTGGREHQSGQPWIIFIHGAGQSHLTWSQQVRAFSYDGHNVLALDLPAHGQSGGGALVGADVMASWVVDVMDKLAIDEAHLVNHSMGGLVSLELGSKHSKRVKSIAFIATAMTIAVNEKLIEMSRNEPQKAHEFMTSLGHGPFGHMHENSVPGASLIGGGLRVMAQNQPDALPADLITCANYKEGAKAAANIKCPTLCLLAELDQMVALKYGLKLGKALGDCETHILQGAGHMLPGERPREINEFLRQFYRSRF